MFSQTIWKVDELRRKLLRMRRAILFILFAIAPFALGQSPSRTDVNRDTVRRLYGMHISEVYRGSDNLVITASFDTSGNLCRADISAIGDTITNEALKVVLDELVPENARGEYKMGTFLDITCVKLVKAKNSKSDSIDTSAMELVSDPCAKCSGVSEEYEKVTITKYGNTNEYSSVNITFHRPECKALEKRNH